jgi:hypothetical protein
LNVSKNYFDFCLAKAAAIQPISGILGYTQFLSLFMNQKHLKIWVETWKHAGDELDDIRRQELQAYDYSKNQAIIDSMLQWTCEHSQVRLTSGLVEQQRLFMKMRTL